MLQRAHLFALALMTAGVWLAPEAASEPSRQSPSPWLRTESEHFEIHYPSALARELDGVVRSAERAYDRISGRLNFALIIKVPLVMFAPSGPMTREQAAAFATSDQVAPSQPHRSRIVLPLPSAVLSWTR
jgi:hypothetical protein